jgi:hypothetical protein
MFVCGFDDTQKIGVPGEHTAPTSLPLRSSNAHRRRTLNFQIALPKSAATRRAGRGRGFSPQTRVFCVPSKPATKISWLARDSADESDSAWSAGGIPCRSRRGITKT